MTLWILGAGGQVGRALTRLAESKDIPQRSFAREHLDILDEGAVAAAIGNEGVLVNCAAYTAVDRAEIEPEVAHAINAMAVAGLSRLASARGLPFIHISTDYVFDGTKAEPYVEDDPIGPATAYGRSKAEGESLVREFCPRHIILRTAWVYAAQGHNFVRSMLRLADSRSELQVVADQHGGPTSADDVAGAILSVVSQIGVPGFEAWGTYHFAGSPVTTWHGFAQAILAGRPDVIVKPITTAEFPTPAHRPHNSALDCGKILRTFGIPQPHWPDSLSKVLDEIQQKGPVR
jgi:dTDP-4-dehydrorhamnose reductase